jgi:hypothetical protein
VKSIARKNEKEEEKIKMCGLIAKSSENINKIDINEKDMVM